MVVMIVLYTSIIWKIYRNSTAMRMRSIPSNTHSTSASFSFNKCFRYQSVNSDKIDQETIQASNFEKSLHPSSNQSSSRSRSGVAEEDKGQNPQSDISLNKKQVTLTHAASEPTTRPSSQNNKLAKKPFRRLTPLNSSNKNSNSPSNGTSRMDRHRRKALKLLITLIVEFFICWTPLFIYHTIGTFNKNFYRSIPNVFVDLILLFSFASASCNPLTYCFMSKRYRSVLYAYLPCCCLNKNQRMFINQKDQRASQLIKALHSSQQQNSIGKKQIEQIRVNLHPNSRLRSKTLN
jgi:hypothetical protein